MGRKREREQSGTEDGVTRAQDDETVFESACSSEGRSGKKKKSKKEKREKQESDDGIVEDVKPTAELREHVQPVDRDVESGDLSVPASRTKRPLPPGYLCRACNQTGHAIYDCPLKVSKIRSDPKKTVFMSHLPRSWKRDNILSFLNGREISGDAISNIKMVTSETDGETEFKGIALVTVIGLEALAKILQLNGDKVADRDIIVKINEPQKRESVKHCFRCGGIHDPSTCNNPRICYKCRTSGHLSSECPKKSRSK
jgi:hypothetical protein